MKDSTQCHENPPHAGTPREPFGLPHRVAPALAKSPVVLAISQAVSPTQSLQRARDLAIGMGEALHVVRVLPECGPAAVLSRRNLTDILRSVEQTLTAHRTTRGWMREVLPDTQAVDRFAILHGNFVERIAVYAREVDARLILISPGEENTGRLVTRLAAATGTPVLVARAPTQNQAIVAATDLRDPGYPVLQLAAALGRQLEAEVIAVHNVHPGAAPHARRSVLVAPVGEASDAVELTWG